MAGCWSRKLANHISSTHQKIESGLEAQCPTRCSSYVPSKGSVPSTNSTTNWKPSVQIPEPTFLIQATSSGATRSTSNASNSTQQRSSSSFPKVSLLQDLLLKYIFTSSFLTWAVSFYWHFTDNVMSCLAQVLGKVPFVGQQLKARSHPSLSLVYYNY